MVKDKDNLLEDIGRMVEVRRYLNKLIIIDFEVEKREFKIFDKKLKCDKWLDFMDWIKVYEKVLKLLENTKSSIKYFNNDFEIETFKIHNNTVEVKMIKENLKENNYQYLLDLENFHKFHDVALKIQIFVIPIKNELHDEIKRANEKSNLSIQPSPDIKEYYPVFNVITDTGTIPSYKPSKLAVEIKTEKEFEPYSPQPVENVKKKIIEKAISPKSHLSEKKNSVPQYKASPITPSFSRKNSRSDLESSEEKNLLDTSINKVRELRSSKTPMCKSPGKKQYFDDSESELDIVTNKKYKRKKVQFQKNNSNLSRKDNQNICSNSQSEVENTEYEKYKDKNKIVENNPHKKKKTSVNWLSKDLFGPKNILTEGLKSKHKKNKNISCCSPVLLSPPIKKKISEEERLMSRKNDEKEIKVMLGVTEQIREINKPTTKVEYRSLHHLEMNEIEKIYETNSELFERKFNKFKKDKNKAKKFDAEGLDHMFTHSILHEKELMEMLKYLHNIFEPNNAIPEFTDIFFNLLIPEWVLLIYMKEYNFTRVDAIQYIKDQEESNICSQMETSCINENIP